MSDEILKTFTSLFSGYKDAFVQHVPPFTIEKGKCKAAHVHYAKYGNYRFESIPSSYSSGDYVPITTEDYRAHLKGEIGLAISPLIDSVGKGEKVQTDVCFFAVIDIDVYGVNYICLIQRLHQAGYVFAPFISKSGGLHLYFFFRNPESAVAVRTALLRIVTIFGLNMIYVGVNKKSKVEIIPAHTNRKAGQQDKCVFLPFFNAENGSENNYLGVDGKTHKIASTMGFVCKLFTSVYAIEKATDSLPYSEAPFCIQMILLSGALGEGEHRNDFMFNVAVYLKTKDASSFTVDDLVKANEYFRDPLELGDLELIYKSVSDKDYQLFGRCKTEPVASFCDKRLCKLREVGVGRIKQNIATNIEFGNIYRMMAEEPYYLWEARLSGEEEYKKLKIDVAENLLSQKTVQTACINALGQAMLTVTQNVWERKLNECLLTLKEVEVPRETDTTELSEMRDLFVRYLSHRQVQSNEAHRVNLKQVYREGDVYYFKTDGFKDYLRVMKFNLGRTNLREKLLEFGCKEGEVFYKSISGEKRSLRCWQKEADDELKNQDVFYDDVVASDTQKIQGNKITQVSAEAGEEMSKALEDVTF